MSTSLRCLVTGSSGYIGGRLVPAARRGPQGPVPDPRPGRLRDVPWADASVVGGDVRTPRSGGRCGRRRRLLPHPRHRHGGTFEERDRDAAGRSPRRPGGGRAADRLPRRRGPRTRTCRRTCAPGARSARSCCSGVPTVVLQAAVILGSGSASFEMLRYLTERLPAMVTPRWVSTRMQPIAIRDVLRYLAGCASTAADVNRSFDIGGPDVLTYAEMMRRYAAAAGLPPRVLVPVPVLTPRLSSHWVGVVTPVPSAIARPLVESLRNEVVCHEDDIAAVRPRPAGGPARLRASRGSRCSACATRRSRRAGRRRHGPARRATRCRPTPTGPAARCTSTSGAPPSAPRREPLWEVIEGIGGENGWYSLPLAWAVRGLIDRLVGGVGLRRGRRDPRACWSASRWTSGGSRRSTRGPLLRLRAEMKVPGLAWLELRSAPDDRAGSSTTSGRSSPARPAGHSTGGRSCRSTASSSAACCATSPQAAERAPTEEVPPPPRPPGEYGGRRRPGPDTPGGRGPGAPRREGRGTPSRGRPVPAGLAAG